MFYSDSTVYLVIFSLALVTIANIWLHSHRWLKNLIFSLLSLAIVSSWTLVVYAVLAFGPTLAK